MQMLLVVLLVVLGMAIFDGAHLSEMAALPVIAASTGWRATGSQEDDGRRRAKLANHHQQG